MTQVNDLVSMTSTTTGTGNLTLASRTGFRDFDSLGTGVSNKSFYGAQHESLDEWEIGIGYASDSTTYVRETVLLSSNSNSLVNFSAGTKFVTNDIPAARQLILTSAGVIPDSAVQESNVTQHEAALGINSSQVTLQTVDISSNTTLTTATHDARMLRIDGTPTLTLDDAMTAGTEFVITHVDNTAQATVDLESASDTLNGVANGSTTVILGINSIAHVRVNSSGEYFIRGNISEVA